MALKGAACAFVVEAGTATAIRTLRLPSAAPQSGGCQLGHRTQRDIVMYVLNYVPYRHYMLELRTPGHSIMEEKRDDNALLI